METGAALERRARGEDLPDGQYTKIEVVFGDVDEAKLQLEEQSAKQR